jgi:hypothetical protein
MLKKPGFRPRVPRSLAPSAIPYVGWSELEMIGCVQNVQWMGLPNGSLGYAVAIWDQDGKYWIRIRGRGDGCRQADGGDPPSRFTGSATWLSDAVVSLGERRFGVITSMSAALPCPAVGKLASRCDRPELPMTMRLGHVRQAGVGSRCSGEAGRCLCSGGKAEASRVADGTFDGAATAIAAVKSCAFGAPLRGCGT